MEGYSLIFTHLLANLFIIGVREYKLTIIDKENLYLFT